MERGAVITDKKEKKDKNKRGEAFLKWCGEFNISPVKQSQIVKIVKKQTKPSEVSGHCSNGIQQWASRITFRQENLLNLSQNGQRLWHVSTDPLPPPVPGPVWQKLYSREREKMTCNSAPSLWLLSQRPRDLGLSSLTQSLLVEWKLCPKHGALGILGPNCPCPCSLIG